MPELIRDTGARSAAKACTWRCFSSAETWGFGRIFSGSATAAFEIMGFDLLFNTCSYFILDRLWALYPPLVRLRMRLSPGMESLARAVTLRLVGTIENFGASYLVTGSLKTSAEVASASVIGKFIGNYFHERLWTEWSPLANFGRKTRISPSEMRMYEMLEAAARESVEWTVPEDRRPVVATALSEGITKGFAGLLPCSAESPKANVGALRMVWRVAVQDLMYAGHVTRSEAVEISVIGGNIIKELSQSNMKGLNRLNR